MLQLVVDGYYIGKKRVGKSYNIFYRPIISSTVFFTDRV